MSKYVGKIVTNQAPAGYSVFFTGTSYLSVPAGSAFAPGTGNFTIEAWVYPTSSGDRFIWTQTVSGTNYFVFQITTTTAGLTMTASGGGTFISGPANSLVQNAWNHVAAVRSSGTVTVYVNGVGGTPTSNTLDLSNTTYTPVIGTYTHSPTTNVFAGYMSNLRYVKGTALYTANFAPPTQLFNITNTSFLSFNSPAIVDQGTANSGSGFPITVSGLSTVSTFTPFVAYNPYNPALGASTPGVWTLDEAMQAAATRQWNMYDPSFQNTTLLLHGNGTNGAQNNTFLDSSSNNFTITRNGNTTQGTFSPFSQTGWSNYFDGSGDFLSWNSGSSVAFGTSDFTVEAFVYVTSTPNTKYIIDARDSSNTGAWAFAFGLGGTGYKLGFFDGTTTIEEATASIPNNSWQHCVAVRSGTTLSVYLNGGRVATATNSKNLNVSPTTSYVGTRYTGSGYDIEGYISNVRIIKGTAAYDPTQTTITVPTAQLTDVTNTVLLTCASNRFFDKNTQATAKTITAAGTPSVQAFSPFAPTTAYSAATVGGSGYFDGTGDYLNTSTNGWTQLSTGNFTVESWVYINAYGSYFSIFDARSSPGFSPWIFGVNTSGFADFFYGTGSGDRLLDNVAVGLNNWVHLAAVRNGTTISLYVNGVSKATVTYSSSINGGSTTPSIGRLIDPVNANGYISNARVVIGTAVYTANFTPPTAPLTAITNTSLLCNFTNAGITDATAKNDLETVGNAQISTTQSKFGGSSMYFDGTGDYLFSPQSNNPQSLNWELVRGDFTIEFWFYANTVAPAIQGLIVKFDGDASSRPEIQYMINLGGSNLNCIPYQGGTVYDITFTSAIAANTWYHVAFVRSGSSFYAFLNGVRNATTRTITGDLNSGVNWPLYIGSYTEGSVNYAFNGYIDELRITRFARYTANFTPQTSQWQDQ